RCDQCGQLLGIARRKAGSMIRCPTCQNDLKVPQAEDVPVPAPGALPAAAPPPVPPALFERDDFEDLLQGGLSAEPRARGSAARPASPPAPARPQPLPPPLAAPAPREQNGWQHGAAPAQVAPVSGVLLSPGRATVLTVVVILTIAIAFGVGVIV